MFFSMKHFDLLTVCQLIGSQVLVFSFGSLSWLQKPHQPSAHAWKTSPRKFWTSKIGLGRMAWRFWRTKTLKFGYLVRHCTFGRQCHLMLGGAWRLVSLLSLEVKKQVKNQVKKQVRKLGVKLWVNLINFKLQQWMLQCWWTLGKFNCEQEGWRQEKLLRGLHVALTVVGFGFQVSEFSTIIWCASLSSLSSPSVHLTVVSSSEICYFTSLNSVINVQLTKKLK